MDGAAVKEAGAEVVAESEVWPANREDATTGGGVRGAANTIGEQMRRGSGASVDAAATPPPEAAVVGAAAVAVAVGAAEAAPAESVDVVGASPDGNGEAVGASECPLPIRGDGGITASSSSSINGPRPNAQHAAPQQLLSSLLDGAAGVGSADARDGLMLAPTAGAATGATAADCDGREAGTVESAPLAEPSSEAPPLADWPAPADETCEDVVAAAAAAAATAAAAAASTAATAERSEGPGAVVGLVGWDAPAGGGEAWRAAECGGNDDAGGAGRGGVRGWRAAGEVLRAVPMVVGCAAAVDAGCELLLSVLLALVVVALSCVLVLV